MSPKKAKRLATGSRNAAQPGSFRPAYTPSSVGSSKVKRTPSSAGAQGAGSYSRMNSTAYSTKAKKKGKGKKVALIVCLVVVLVLAGGGTAAALYINNLNASIQETNQEDAAAIKEVLAPTTTVSTDPFYMMLIGTDDREGVDGARSDTNIVARVDPGTGTVSLMSIPRDTAISLDGYGTQKFNAAYAYGGVAGTIKEANSLLGVQCSHYAEVHFDALIEFIDAIGGVEVDVPMEIDDEDAGGKVPAGLQTLDGEHAMIFARSRSYDSGDFQRTTSQRLLIEATINKIMSLPTTEIPGVVQKMAACVTTDMSITDLMGYATQFQKQGVTMYSMLMPCSTATKDGISYVVCDKTTLQKAMDIMNAGGDPSTVAIDSTITSSAQAKEKGVEATPNHGSGDDSYTYGADSYIDNSSGGSYASGNGGAYDYSSGASSGYDSSVYTSYDSSAYTSYDSSTYTSYDSSAYTSDSSATGVSTDATQSYY